MASQSLQGWRAVSGPRGESLPARTQLHLHRTRPLDPILPCFCASENKNQANERSASDSRRSVLRAAPETRVVHHNPARGRQQASLQCVLCCWSRRDLSESLFAHAQVALGYLASRCSKYRRLQWGKGCVVGKEMQGLGKARKYLSRQDRIDFRRDVDGQCNTNLEADHRP